MVSLESMECKVTSDDIANYCIAERRPITEPVWDGVEALPVGTIAEVLANGEWVKGKIMYNGEKCSLLLDDKGEDWFFSRKIVKFRPARSPDDVARSNAIGEMERAYEELTGKPAREAEEYYDFIAAGKVTGVNIVK